MPLGTRARTAFSKAAKLTEPVSLVMVPRATILANSSRPHFSLANWVMGDFSRILNAQQCAVSDSPISPVQLAELLKLIDKGTISGKIGKSVIEEMYATGKDAGLIIKDKGLAQISDEGALLGIIDQVIADNGQSVEDYRAGKKQALGFLVGQIMKATKGQANPGIVNQLLKEKLT